MLQYITAYQDEENKKLTPSKQIALYVHTEAALTKQQEV